MGDTKTEFYEPYAVGLTAASVCTNLSDDEVTRRLNADHPTGIPSAWSISTSPTFASGAPHPNQCEQRDDCRHVLFEC